MNAGHSVASNPHSRAVPVAAGLTVGAVLFGLVAGAQVARGHPAAVLGLTAVVLPIVMWKRPSRIPAMLLGAALLVEQFTSLPVAPKLGQALPPVAPPTITSHIPLFRGVGGVHLAPADILLVGALVVYMLKVPAARRRWPRGAPATAVAALVASVFLGIIVGLMHHGQFRVAFMEARPFTYLAIAFTATAVLVSSRTALRAVLWSFVAVEAVRAILGINGFIAVRNMNPRPEAVLGHEDSFFFAIFLLLVAALWLFAVPGRLRTVATQLTPFVLVADLANDRRTAWLVLGGGLVVLATIALICLPARRPLLWRLIAAVSVFLAIYLPVFWNKGGGLAQPARALHSMIAPDPRDALSDKYRIDENANLNFNIAHAGPLGKGYGVPIDYALPIEDISGLDPFIAYVPHNGLLYVLMRLGLVGGAAFWSLLGLAMISGARLARAREAELAVVGALGTCAVVGYVLQGAVDQGFFFYRVAIVMGVLLGLVEAGRRLSGGTTRP